MELNETALKWSIDSMASGGTIHDAIAAYLSHLKPGDDLGNKLVAIPREMPDAAKAEFDRLMHPRLDYYMASDNIAEIYRAMIVAAKER